MSHRLMVVSGFLGSGKTTAISAIGKMLIAQGKKVGVVTNDQGDNLVDTNYIKNEGMSVFEISEGCFCCSFDAFTKKLQNLAENQMPDIILAEPIGSCINLIATIFKPIINNYTKDFNLAPLSVIADPKRVRRMMNDNGNFKNEVNYMFDCQLAEADIILLNKIDKLEKSEVDELVKYLQIKYSPAQVLPISAENGENIQLWYDLVSNKVAMEKSAIKVNYEIYARAENSLSWCSEFSTVKSNEKIDFNYVIKSVLNNIKKQLENVEIAHIKAYGVSGYDFSKAGITSSDGEINFNKNMEQKCDKVNLIINARVECEPKVLENAVKRGLEEAYNEFSLTVSNEKFECYAPDYKMPTCRF